MLYIIYDILGFAIQCRDSFFNTLPPITKFKYNDPSPSFNICISIPDGNPIPEIYSVFRGVNVKVEAMKSGNSTDNKYVFTIRLPRLSTNDCDSKVKIAVRHFVGGVEKMVQLQTKIQITGKYIVANSSQLVVWLGY